MLNISHTRSTLFAINQTIQKKCGKDVSIDFDYYNTMISKKPNVALYDNDNTDCYVLITSQVVLHLFHVK
jgi:hypothetical protein